MWPRASRIGESGVCKFFKMKILAKHKAPHTRETSWHFFCEKQIFWSVLYIILSIGKLLGKQILGSVLYMILGIGKLLGKQIFGSVLYRLNVWKICLVIMNDSLFLKNWSQKVICYTIIYDNNNPEVFFWVSYYYREKINVFLWIYGCVFDHV